MKKLLFLILVIRIFSCEKDPEPEKLPCYNCEIVTTKLKCSELQGPLIISGPEYVEKCGSKEEIDAWETSMKWDTVLTCPVEWHIAKIRADCHNN